MRIPKYRKHSTRNVGFAEHNGQRLYFPGKYKSDESYSAYRTFLRERGLEKPKAANLSRPTLATIVFEYLNFAMEHYGTQPGSEYHKMRVACAPLQSLAFEKLAAEDFGPLKLKALRETIIDTGEQRETVNAKIGRIKRLFCWAASEELVSGSVYHALLSVKGERKGRSRAPEGKKRRPVLDWVVDATMSELSPLIQAMVSFQRLTGARSSSVCRAKAEQFDRSQSPWLWRPRHKNEHLDIELILPIGPKSRAIILSYLSRAEATGGYLFDPRTQRNNRRYGPRYTAQSYRQAVQRAARRVNKTRAELRSKMETAEERETIPNLPIWSPHQLRHARGKAVRDKHGLEGTQAALGQETFEMAKRYSERNLELAKQIATEMG